MQVKKGTVNYNVKKAQQMFSAVNWALCPTGMEGLGWWCFEFTAYADLDPPPHKPLGNFNIIKFTYMYFSCLKQEKNSGSASTCMFTIDGLPSLINVCSEDKHCDGIEVQTVSAKYWNNIFSRSAVARS